MAERGSPGRRRREDDYDERGGNSRRQHGPIRVHQGPIKPQHHPSPAARSRVRDESAAGHRSRRTEADGRDLRVQENELRYLEDERRRASRHSSDHAGPRSSPVPQWKGAGGGWDEGSMAALSALQSPMRIEEKMALLGSGGQCGEDRRETGGAEETEVSGQEQSIPKKRPNRAERNESMQRAVVEACFRHFDLDGSGYIEKQELAALTKQLGQAFSREELNALLKTMDTETSDGKISLKEFSDWWMREFCYTSMRDRLRKNLARLWLKIRSAAGEPAPIGRSGVGWGGQFGWKALTSAKSNLSSGGVKIGMGWGSESSAAASAQITGEKMSKEGYQEAMEGLQAPGSAVLVLHSTLVLRETTAPEDLQALQTALQSAIDRHCADACKALLKSAADLGVDVEGRMAGSPARGAGAAVVSIKGRVQPTGANTDQGPEEHSLDIDVFAGGVLLESVVKTMAKAGLSFTDFPAFNIECESSMSLRQLLAAGKQQILPLLAFRFELSWTVRKRLIRKLLGLVDEDGLLNITLGTLLVSVTSEMEMLGPGELLADLETPDDAEAAATKNLKEGGADDGEDDWKGVLQGLTGKQLKGWLQKMSGDLGRALSGSAPADADDDPLMSSLRRFALYIPNLRLYIAGAKVEVAQPGEGPLWPLDVSLNPDQHSD